MYSDILIYDVVTKRFFTKETALKTKVITRFQSFFEKNCERLPSIKNRDDVINEIAIEIDINNKFLKYRIIKDE